MPRSTTITPTETFNMKILTHVFYTLLLTGLFIQCSVNQPIERTKKSPVLTLNQHGITAYTKSITAAELETNLRAFSSAEMNGRRTGSEGQKKAANYLIHYYQKNNIPAAKGDYRQNLPPDFLPFNKIKQELTDNIVAYIEGTDYPEEVVIISAHYDHLGHINDDLFFGADDNGSGTVALLEIAQAFQLAKEQGKGPKRSLLFLHLTAEEIGLIGSKYYVQHPIFPLQNTVVDLNIDMIGRTDKLHQLNETYLYLVGSDRHSSHLHELEKRIALIQNPLMLLDYKYNALDDPERIYYRSDHYNFAKKNIPVTFFFNGLHVDYHQPTDTPDKINYLLLAQRTRYIFSVAWEIANRAERLALNVRP